MEDLQSLRLQAYRQMLLLDPVEDDSIQARTQLWQDTERSIAQLQERRSATPEEEAELLLTLFVLLQVGTRDYSTLQQVINRTYDLLPHLQTAASPQSPAQFRLRLHLLVYLYNETEDDSLLPCIEILTLATEADDMSEEDYYLHKISQSIEIP